MRVRRKNPMKNLVKRIASTGFTLIELLVVDGDHRDSREHRAARVRRDTRARPTNQRPFQRQADRSRLETLLPATTTVSFPHKSPPMDRILHSSRSSRRTSRQKKFSIWQNPPGPLSRRMKSLPTARPPWPLAKTTSLMSMTSPTPPTRITLLSPMASPPAPPGRIQAMRQPKAESGKARKLS